MSYPTPPGSGNPYGQPPAPGGWQQQWQGASHVPPTPAVPPGPPPPAVPGQSPFGQYGGPAPGAVPPSNRGGNGRRVLGALLTALGVLGTLGGGALAAHAYSNSQEDVPNAEAYGPVLWRNETAGELFPATVGDPPNSEYEASDEKIAQWRRMGISQETSCSKGLSGETKKTAQQLGCEAVVRATYVDLTGEMVATVAIIVLPKSATDAQEMGEYLQGQSGEEFPEGAVVPFKVAGTLAAKWDESRRNGMGGAGLGGNLPYAVAVTTGAVDGRGAGALPDEFGEYGADVEDRRPWMNAAEALSKSFHVHITRLER